MMHRPFSYILTCLLVTNSIKICNAFLLVKQNQALYPSTYDKQDIFVLNQPQGKNGLLSLDSAKNHSKDIQSIINVRGGGDDVTSPTKNKLPKRASLLFSFTTLIFALSFKFFPLQIMSKLFNIIIEKDSINRFAVQLIGTNLFSLAVTSYHGTQEKISREQCIAKGLQKRCIFFAILMITDRARGLGLNYTSLIALEAFYVVCTFILLSSGSDRLKELCTKAVAAFSTINGAVLFFIPGVYSSLFGLSLETQLTKNLVKVVSSSILLNGLYITSLISNKFDPIQAVGIVSFALIPIVFQVQKLASFSLLFGVLISLGLSFIGILTLGKTEKDD